MSATSQTDIETSPSGGLAAIRRLGAALCVAVAIGGALAELALAWVWLSPEYVTTLVAPHIGLAGVPIATGNATRLMGFIVSMLPLSVLFYALHQAYELFDAFRLGNIFAADAPVRLRRVGLCMLALAALRPLTATLLGLVLTAVNPEGQRFLIVGIGVEDYMIAVFGGMILAMGHVMVEASRLADEHRQIV
ncbi:MAG: DUF2975 domain-containing protein [Hyphomicrobium sp.]